MKQEKNIFKILLFFITFLTTFFIWYFTSYKIDFIWIVNNWYTIEDDFKSKLINNIASNKINLDLFWRVYSLVENNYYSSWDLNDKDLEYWMISWFIDSLWDRFSEFLTPEDTKVFMDNLSWDFEWIWAVIQKHDLWIIIDRVIAWSPALKWWILKWDIVVEVNWIELRDLTNNEAVEYIKWPAWTIAKLKIIREWESDFLYKDIIRDKITIPSVATVDIWEPNIWYITLSMFWEHTSNEFSTKLKDFSENENIEGIIIDLRDNWGWFLQSALEITSNFLERNKPIVSTKYRNDIMNNDYKSTNRSNIFDKKLVILINWNSASASEIMAWALSDHNKAILVWTTTYWKWSVQQPFELPDWSLLKLTIAKWYTPSWHSIENNWIDPDIEVVLTRDDFINQNDRQLNTAIEVMKTYIENNTPWIVIEKFRDKIKEENKKNDDDNNEE